MFVFRLFDSFQWPERAQSDSVQSNGLCHCDCERALLDLAIGAGDEPLYTKRGGAIRFGNILYIWIYLEHLADELLDFCWEMNMVNN